MARPKKRTSRGLRGNPADPRGYTALAREYLESLRVKNYSPMTVHSREIYLEYFRAWAEERGITRPAAITRPILERYQRWLFHHRKPNGQPLTFSTQKQRLLAVGFLFKWLARTNHILYNPAAELELPRLPMTLPKHVLSVEQFERLLAQPDVEDPIGLRDRAILETFYSTGIRRMELLDLKLSDLDRDRGTLSIRCGKGQRARVVPIGERAVAWIDRYLEESRPRLAVEPDDQTLFVNYLGTAFHRNALTPLVRNYILAAGLGKIGSCHLLRHSMATLMLEHGADVRYIQQLLGHSRMESTQIYTHVAIRALKEVHTRHHPGASLQRSKAASLNTPPPADAPEPPPVVLLHALADEAAEEADELEAESPSS